jgi:hypothetical protein
MTPQAIDVATSIAREIKAAADLLHITAQLLQRQSESVMR